MKLAVFFPGIGYHCDKPLLYYARKIAASCGYDIITLSYTYDGRNIRGNKEKMNEAYESLYKQASESLESVSFGQYDEILFISKSVGTIIASTYAYVHKISCRQVLYTPLEKTFEHPHEDAIAFIGTSDPWSRVDDVIGLAKASGVPIRVFEGCNHSLEGSDTMGNLEIIEKVMQDTLDFCTKT